MSSFDTLCREEARLSYLVMKDKFSKVTYSGDHVAFRVHINDTTQFSVSIYPGNSGNMPCDGNTYPQTIELALFLNDRIADLDEVMGNEYFYFDTRASNPSNVQKVVDYIKAWKQ